MMSKVISKLHLGSKANVTDGSSKSNELNECKKFFIHLPKVLDSVLQPGHRFMSVPSSKGKKNTVTYEEKNLVKYIQKHNAHLTGSLHDALEDTASTYTQINDLKSERDLKIQADLYKPINETILHDLNQISKLKKSVADMESEVNSARKGTEKNPQDTLALEKLNRAISALEQAKENHSRAIITFKQDEPKRIAMLKETAQILQDFYRKAADSFAQLVSNLEAIREKASSMEQNLTLNQNGMLGVDTTYDDPEPSFGYTTTIKGSVPLPEYENKSTNELGRCKALYDFQAEADDDLSLKKGDIATILEKVDDQWYYGEKDGKKGHFPVEFVEKI